MFWGKINLVDNLVEAHRLNLDTVVAAGQLVYGVDLLLHVRKFGAQLKYLLSRCQLVYDLLSLHYLVSVFALLNLVSDNS
jgi:hypothetical protein